MPRQPGSIVAEVDEAEARRQRKAAKRAAKEAALAEEEAPAVEVDEEEAKRQRKAAKKAAKQAAAAAEVAEEEPDEDEAKRQRKAAKKAAKEAAVIAEVQEEAIDEGEAKKQKKAAKKAAKQAVGTAAEKAVDKEGPTIPAKTKKRAVEAEDKDAEEVPEAKKSKTEAEEIVACDDVKTLKVFIKGLPYSTTEEQLRKDFGECGEITSLQLPMNDAGKPKGFAFMAFATQEGFDAAMKYDNTDYGGRFIGVSKANDDSTGKGKGKGRDGDWECPNCGDNVFARNSACRKCGTAKPGGAEKVGQDNERTVFIRGLPWSATEETIRKDFAECGEIEKLTLPLNEEGKPKGISFIKYTTQEGVKAALEFDNTDYGSRNINVCKAGEGKGKGKDGKGKGKDGKGKGKDGKGKAKGKGKVTSESKAKSSGCIVAGAGEKKTFDDSDEE